MRATTRPLRRNRSRPVVFENGRHARERGNTAITRLKTTTTTPTSARASRRLRTRHRRRRPAHPPTTRPTPDRPYCDASDATLPWSWSTGPVAGDISGTTTHRTRRYRGRGRRVRSRVTSLGRRRRFFRRENDRDGVYLLPCIVYRAHVRALETLLRRRDDSPQPETTPILSYTRSADRAPLRQYRRRVHHRAESSDDGPGRPRAAATRVRFLTPSRTSARIETKNELKKIDIIFT